GTPRRDLEPADREGQMVETEEARGRAGERREPREDGADRKDASRGPPADGERRRAAQCDNAITDMSPPQKKRAPSASPQQQQTRTTCRKSASAALPSGIPCPAESPITASTTQYAMPMRLPTIGMRFRIDVAWR